MRQIATVQNHPEIKRLMIYAIDGGAYMFLYNTMEDAGCCEDLWFNNVSDAEEDAKDNYNISPEDWKMIDDPLPSCQDDMIAPVKIKGRTYCSI